MAFDKEQEEELNKRDFAIRQEIVELEKRLRKKIDKIADDLGWNEFYETFPQKKGE